MRTLLLISVLAVAVRGEEPGSGTMRQKLRAKIMESVTPPTSAKPSGDKKEDEDVVPAVVVMKPMVVAESKRARDLEAAIARESQKRADEQFSATKGGTIYRKHIGNRRIELGGWFDAAEGWKFLKISW